MRFGRYDRIVEHYAAMWPLLVPGYLPILNSMRDIVQALDERPERLIDVGCGPGSATVAVSPVCSPAAEVTLADGSEAMIEAAQGLLGGHVADVFVGDIAQASFAKQVFTPSTYDLALCSFALHHLDDAQKAETVIRLAATLKPGGMLLLADEVAVDRPAGLDILERVRARVIHEHMASGRITKAFWDLETSLPEELHLPFLPARMEDLRSWMARAGLGVTCPVVIFGSALMLGVRPSAQPAHERL